MRKREITKPNGFKTFKERGEWVELRFMAEVMRHGFAPLKPWGDSAPYDVGVESGSRVLRVQVKSTDCRSDFGYICQFRPSYTSRHYTLEVVDFFAAYIIPEDVWYVIPAPVLLLGHVKKVLTLCPQDPLHPDRYKYECYKEAWSLFGDGWNQW